MYSFSLSITHSTSQCSEKSAKFKCKKCANEKKKMRRRDGGAATTLFHGSDAGPNSDKFISARETYNHA